MTCAENVFNIMDKLHKGNKQYSAIKKCLKNEVWSYLEWVFWKQCTTYASSHLGTSQDFLYARKHTDRHRTTLVYNHKHKVKLFHQKKWQWETMQNITCSERNTWLIRKLATSIFRGCLPSYILKCYKASSQVIKTIYFKNTWPHRQQTKLQTFIMPFLCGMNRNHKMKGNEQQTDKLTDKIKNCSPTDMNMWHIEGNIRSIKPLTVFLFVK